MRKKIHLRVVHDGLTHQDKLMPLGDIDDKNITREVVRDVIAQTILVATFPKVVPTDIEGWRDSARIQATKIVSELESRNLLKLEVSEVQEGVSV